MTDFSIGEAVGTGFRVVRRKPLTIVMWFLFQFLTALLSAALFLSLTGSAMADLQTVQAAGPAADPTQILAIFSRMVVPILLFIPYGLLINAIITTAASRAVLEPDNSSFGYLRLGASELRMMVVQLVIGLIVLCTYIGAAMAGALLLVLLRAVGGVAGAIIGGVALFVLVLGGVLYVATRFSMAAAQTLDTRSINIFGSWELTKGRVGKVFLVYLLCGLIIAAIYLVLIIATLAVVGIGAGTAGALASMQPKMTTMAAIFAPATLIYYFVVGLVAAFVLMLILTPGAYMYQKIVDRSEEVF